MPDLIFHALTREHFTCKYVFKYLHIKRQNTFILLLRLASSGSNSLPHLSQVQIPYPLSMDDSQMLGRGDVAASVDGRIMEI